ncbi:MAG: hypothetical protein HY610_04760, partial [Elusimicrobia bacterium]|nr:hypothetical protein [Elusimicrobiota bacterium]
MNTNPIIELTVESLAYGGEGIARQHPTLSAQIGDLGGQARQHPTLAAQIGDLGGQARQHPTLSAQIG